MNAGLGSHVPTVHYNIEKGLIYGTIDAIDRRLVASAHDISSGGLIVSTIEMLLACAPTQPLGIDLHLKQISSELRDDKFLFSESSGMILEIDPSKLENVKSVFSDYGSDVHTLGTVTTSGNISVFDSNDQSLIDLSIQEIRKQWRGDYGLTIIS